jgi:nucleotide-binding universal stress UspA family protein
MGMFKKIIWATDGSEAADLALPYVEQLANESGASTVLCYSSVALVGPRGAGYPIHVDDEEIQDKLEGQAVALVDQGVDTRLRILRGDTLRGAAYDVAKEAAEEEADLIVVGTRGHTALGGLFLGSFTQRLLHIAHCPVLVVPVAASDGSEPEGARDQALA